jgi:hypothetical protein
MSTLEANFQAELAHIQAESIGWIPLDKSGYLHIGSIDSPTVIEVVGLPKQEMQGSTLLWVF